MSELPSFDNLLDLHRKDPEAFEAMRHQVLDDYIHSIPNPRRRRIEGLQFKIDARRKLADTPMEACIEMSNMMHETFWEMSCSLNGFSSISSEEELAALEAQQNKPSATILTFKPLN
ncbi:MAG: DUF3135 domain-containing protein [Pseudomonadales bacterium]